MPTKWLQERAKGSKNGPGMPPLRAFCGTDEVEAEAEELLELAAVRRRREQGTPVGCFL